MLKIDGLLLVDTGIGNGDTKLVKETPYDTTLTVASDKDLADMSGSVFGCSDAYGDGPFTQTPYKLVTSDIESVTDASSEITSPLVYLLTNTLDLAASSPDFGSSVPVDVTTTDTQQLDDYDDPSYTYKYLSLFLGDDSSSDIKVNILGGSPWRVMFLKTALLGHG